MKYFSLLIVLTLVMGVCFVSTINAAITDNTELKQEELSEDDASGKKIPSFKLKNTSDDEISFEDYKDKNTVIFLFSSKCPYSINSAKYFNELLKDNTEITLLAVCLDSEIGNVNEGGKKQKQIGKDFSEKYLKDLTNVQVLIADDMFRQDFSRFFKVQVLQKTPLHLFVDGDFRCTSFIKGSTDKEELKKAIEQIKN